jgi:dolichol-phosphate mannosyltransferase
MDKNLLTLVLPVHNEQEVLPQTIRELRRIEVDLAEMALEYELIFVNDGSTDGSGHMLDVLANEDSRICALHLTRNFGHQAAISAGIAHSRGDVVAIMDADLQDPPEALLQLLAKWREGYQVVFAIRKNRKEWFGKRFAYWFFYRIMRTISEIEIPLDSGDFCVMKKHVVDNMLKFKEKNPFLRGIRAWVGFKQIGVEYERQARLEGESGYTLKKLLKIAMDGIFSFSTVPIRVITVLGILGLCFAVIYSSLVIYGLLVHGIHVKGFATLAIIISFFSSLILICLGIIGEYIVRIYNEVRDRPYVIIEETINI